VHGLCVCCQVCPVHYCVQERGDFTPRVALGGVLRGNVACGLVFGNEDDVGNVVASNGGSVDTGYVSMEFGAEVANVEEMKEAAGLVRDGRPQDVRVTHNVEKHPLWLMLGPEHNFVPCRWRSFTREVCFLVFWFFCFFVFLFFCFLFFLLF